MGYILWVVWLVLGFENMHHPYGSIPGDPGSGWKGPRYHLKQIATRGGYYSGGGAPPQLTHNYGASSPPLNNDGGAHVSYAATDQVQVLADAFNPAVLRAWAESGRPQLNAYEEQAAALGRPLWPRPNGHVPPNQNLANFIQNNNKTEHGGGSHDWNEEPSSYGYVPVDHEQAAAYHAQAAAFHTQYLQH